MPHLPGTYHLYEKNRNVVVTNGTRERERLCDVLGAFLDKVDLDRLEA